MHGVAYASATGPRRHSNIWWCVLFVLLLLLLLLQDLNVSLVCRSYCISRMSAHSNITFFPYFFRLVHVSVLMPQDLGTTPRESDAGAGNIGLGSGAQSSVVQKTVEKIEEQSVGAAPLLPAVPDPCECSSLTVSCLMLREQGLMLLMGDFCQWQGSSVCCFWGHFGLRRTDWKGWGWWVALHHYGTCWCHLVATSQIRSHPSCALIAHPAPVGFTPISIACLQCLRPHYPACM